jgi:SagB-type dehydrogenase family enzyme
MQLPELAALLTRTARVVLSGCDDFGVPITHRPYPSAGARHPIDLRVAAIEVDSLDSGSYVFDPMGCSLNAEGDIPEEAIAKVREQAEVSRGPAAGIVCVAHFERTLARYPAGSSLVWRDAGILLGLLQLVATDLGLASCIVGATGSVERRRDPSSPTSARYSSARRRSSSRARASPAIEGNVLAGGTGSGIAEGRRR